MQAIKSDANRLSVESDWTGIRWFATFSLYLYKKGIMIMILKMREYILSIPSSAHSDINYVSLTAYNISDAIDKFSKEYPVLSRKYVLNNIEDLTEIEENQDISVNYDEIF